MQELPHEGEALRACRRHGARAAGGGADHGAHRGVFAFDGDELGVDFAVGDILGEDLHDLGLRGDGVGGHDVGIDLAHRFGDRLVAGDRQDRCHSGHSYSFSSTLMVMASTGHSAAQMPQPLQ